MPASSKIDALLAREEAAESTEFPRLPLDSFSLIDRLDEQYPARCKKRGESEEFHQRYAGKRDLIDLMIMWREHEKAGGTDGDSTDTAQ